MADPFYSYHWNPVRHGYSSQIRPLSSKPKVVNIPVNFVYSDNASSKKASTPTTASTAADRNAAAVAIQKVVRGFLVRMNVRVVRRIAMEVDEIERKVREEEVKIRMDIKERIRVSEELMALLLRLDSVRWVRDLRKNIVRRVMGLQEMIDSIAASADGNRSRIDMSGDPEGLAGESVEESSILQTMDLQETNDPEIIPAATDGNSSTIDMLGDPEGVAGESVEDSSAHHTSELQESNEPGMELEIEIPAAVESPTGKIDLIETTNVGIPASVITEDNEESTSESTKSSAIDNQKATDQSHDTDVGMEIENRAAVESPKGKSDMVNMEEIESPEADVSEAEEPPEGVRGLKEMMERMAVENETLKMMVSQLCETSAEQCRLMESLAGRVNNLEQAVHRMDRRKKSKRGAARP